MALTATAQSALPDRSWDEMIVPALRKRLESESLAISKRMSAASITSADDLILTSTPIVRHKVKTSDSSVGKSAVSSTPSEKPSAIPRPSLNYSRPIVTTAQGPSNVPSSSSGSSKPLSSSSSSSTRPPANRSRTYSQPYPFDPSGPAKDSRSGATSTFNTATTTTSTRTPHPNNSILPTPVSSRPSTPITISATTATTTTTATVRTTDVKPTRIPKVTNNTSKAIAINGHVKGGEGDRQAQAFLTPETSPETWQVYENGHLAGSQSSLNVHRHQRQQQNGGPLLHEQPPFSAASSIEVFDMQNSNHSRASMEEETPFEHWYRGDLSRNGGVGELRIGSKMEMLEIANYGHRLRQNNTASSRAGVSSINYGSRRRRADSFGAAGRDSVMFDDSYAAIDMVLDEMPLTDMEGDTETDREMSFTRDATIVHQQQSSPHSYSQPSLPTTHVRTTSASGSRIPIGQRSVSGSTTATTSNDQTQQSRSRKNSQIPRPPTQQSDKTSVTSSSRNASSEQQQHQHQQQPPTPTPARAYAAANQPFPQSQPLATSTPKRGRAKSPATPSKKPKPSTGQKRSKSAVDTRAGGGASAGNKEDIAEDEGEMLADAIPSWTKPVPKGNWDEVVLPVVARKMGLDDQYEEETGVPQPKKQEQEIVPPQPGTFGFTPPRPRPSRGGHTDEFGQYPMQDSNSSSSHEHWDEKTAHADPHKSGDDKENEDEKTMTTPPQTPEPKVKTKQPRRPPTMDLAEAKRPMSSRRREGPPSPAPFSHYTVQQQQQQQQGEVDVGNGVVRPRTPSVIMREEEDAPGCCRCVIM